LDIKLDSNYWQGKNYMGHGKISSIGVATSLLGCIECAIYNDRHVREE